jgi:hypothetical protein
MTLVPVPGYGAPDLSQQGSLAAFLDRALLAGHTYRKEFPDPEGLLSTLPAIATTLTGVLTGHWLRSEKPLLERIAGMFVVGMLLTITGLIWNGVFPVNKPLWTSSYVVLTTGFALQTLAAFQDKHDVILGLNEKEAQHVAGALEVLAGEKAGQSHEARMISLATAIRERLGIRTVVVHPTHYAVAADAGGAARAAGPYTAQPKISTGAGDHFNAGFCVGQLIGCDLAQSLQMGVATSGFYVRQAISPNREQLIGFLQSL